MDYPKNTICRKGAALLIVLFIVMAIAVLSLGFLSKSSAELNCGANMALRTQMDYLAGSGLEHARGLLLNPQDVSSEFWTGALRQQLVAGSSDYYDVSVTKNNYCNFRISCTAYREKGSSRIGGSSLNAELRFNPCVGYWQGASQAIPSQVTITGDVYCGDTLNIYNTIYGDVYSRNTINIISGWGSVSGQKYQNYTAPPVNLPVLPDYSSYYYIGSTKYFVTVLGSDTLQNITLGPTPSNPAGIYYRSGDLQLAGNVQITGMLVVSNDLKMNDSSSTAITAVKNFPALLVGNILTGQGIAARLNVTGYVQVGCHIDMKDKWNERISVVGALYVLGDGIKNTSFCSVTVTASPTVAAIQVWPTAGVSKRWTPAAGAFYKSITRP